MPNMGLRAHRLSGAALLLAALHLALAQCPEVTSVFDLPAIHKCQGALEKLWEQPGCSGAAAEAADRPPAACCGPALEFMGAKCDCWRTFDSSTLAGVQDLVARCPPPQLPAAVAGGGGQVQGSKAVAVATTEQQQQRQQQQQQQQPFKIYVGVLSASKKRAARDAIRAGWATSPLLHRVRFFLARSPNDTLFDEVRREAVAHGDMVVLPLVAEHYDNITHQTLEIVRMAAADPEVTHVLKVDDDSFVRPGPLVEHLRKLPPRRLFWGFIEDPGGGPHRNPESQWFTSKEEWASERYPIWAHGAGYVLSADLAREIAAGASVKPQGGWRLFKLEDISMGAWLEWVEREGGPINRVKDTRFNFNGCNARDLVSHYISPDQQRCMWEAGGRCMRRCPGPGAKPQQQGQQQQQQGRQRQQPVPLQLPGRGGAQQGHGQGQGQARRLLAAARRRQPPC